VRQAKGRERVGFVSRTVGRHLHVIPTDVVPLVNAGRLDRRLFDVTTLLEYGYDDRRADLPLIVTYTGGEQGKAAVRANAATANATVARELPAVNGLAVKENRRYAVAFWNGLTAAGIGAQSAGAQSADGQPQVGKVWLDGLRQPTLDASVPLIGAPRAWQAGYTGNAVPVGVVDTGVDDTHPDLAGKVVANQNFTDDGDTLDHVGHGTHVASTITGSGAASGGRYRGVAPDARLYSAKVCVSYGCQESWILAGMQWVAAEQNAKVVNMSLGGGDTPEVDPLEQAVQTLTAQYGTLFVIAAGNSGEDASVGSPATADDALAVGAVTKTDELASFSSRGPRVGDSALKPEITAPGVDIVAARGKDGEIGPPTGPEGRYLRLSGTSMATPHVSGAAAILAHRHPDWKSAQLKAALMAAAKPNPRIGVYAQGAGRVDIGRAVHQTVTASPASVSFGLQTWPHGDDPVISRNVTYHNHGASAVRLNLTLNTGGTDGKATPAGLFTLAASTVTVPAGGDALVRVTVDTRVAGPDGYAGGDLTATAGDLAVQTPLAVDKEVESHDLTVTHLDRAGKATDRYDTMLFRVDKPGFYPLFDPSGTVRARLPKGRYAVVTVVFAGDREQPELTELVQPALNLDKAQGLAMDARLGRPVSVAVPRPGATSVLGALDLTLQDAGGYRIGVSILTRDFNGVRSAQVGGAGKVEGLVSQVSSQWGQVDADGRVLNSPYAYLLNWFERGRFPTGFSRTLAERELARVRADLAEEATGTQAEKVAFARPPGDNVGGWAAGFGYDLPGTRTEYYNTDSGVERSSLLFQQVPGTDPHFPFPVPISSTESTWTAYRAGVTYHETWNQGVFGPAFPPADSPYPWAGRSGDTMTIGAPMYSDGAGRPGYSMTDTATTTVDRDGARIGEEPAVGGRFTVPPGPGQYRVAIDATRVAPFILSTRSSTVWTFRSRRVDGDKPLALPLSAIRFTPRLDPHNAAPADAPFVIPVQVQRQAGSAAGRVATLTVRVSFDDGQTWQKAVVLREGSGGVALLRHPKGSGFVSLKAAATDPEGNTVEETIIRAYRYRSVG
jgi:subtilisin family serine protease